jgi:hypothetical protein
MPGYLINVGSTINCAHMPGQAQPAAPTARVKVMGQAIVVQTTQYTVSGCALTGTQAPPCTTAQWTSGATRVKAQGTPVLLQDSQSTCTPSGTPLSCMVVQARVKGT